ncbi:hypothetical protein FIBSPDRAFT_959966 [Athelia psychrophila]|uniref:Uncharacterized protein n=1 Tax=Athelia psychrophila TaxID=1759441 RepID=A0A166CYC3_9AGAM|nr:hypothetical protein FIBSPDRAFT_959966 [Fibularhizoctonia sp. CBS 109695]
MDPNKDPHRKKADDDARRQKARLAERQRRRAEEAEEDARVEAELRAEEARIAQLAGNEETCQERRAREDAELQERWAEEDRAAKREAERKKEAERQGRPEVLRRPFGNDSDSTATRGRVFVGSLASRRGGRQRSPVGAFAMMFPPRPPQHGTHHGPSMTSSAEDMDDMPETTITGRSRSSNKRSTKGSHREESCSQSRGGGKHARKVEPLIPGVKCVHYAHRNQSCVPVRGTGKTCQACRTARRRCENPMDAGSDRAWTERALELGDEPGPFDRLYGPVATPVRGFKEVDDHFWGKWLDIQSRISLQVVNTINQTNALLEAQTEFLRQNASAATLSTLTTLHSELIRQHTNGDTGAVEFYRRLTRDYRSLTGVDLNQELLRGEEEDVLESAVPASDSGPPEDVVMEPKGHDDGEGEEEHPGEKPASRK